jgi:hypothetical protein
VGGATGAVAGSLAQPVGGTIVGAMAGATLGAKIGATVGAAYATRKIVVEIQASPRYQKWRIKAIAKNLFPIFEKILGSDEFIDFKCPMSLFLMQIPVVTPCNHVFEKIQVEKWLIDHSTNQDCPTCRAPLQASQLVYHEQLVLDIITAARKQLAILKTSPSTNAAELAEGFEVIIQDKIDLVSQVHAAKSKVELEIAFSFNQSEDEYLEMQRKEFRAKKAALGIASWNATSMALNAS